MKRLMAAAALLMTLPLLAEEAQPVKRESELVKAAKKSTRGTKKPRIVITNATVKASKGHITTSEKSSDENLPKVEIAAPGPASDVVEQPAPAPAVTKARRPDKAPEVTPEDAFGSEELFAEDPALAEKRAADAAAAAEKKKQ